MHVDEVMTAFSRAVILQPRIEQILGDTARKPRKTTSEAGDVIDDRSDEILIRTAVVGLDKKTNISDGAKKK